MKGLMMALFYTLLALLLIAGVPLPTWLWCALAGAAVGVTLAGIASRRQ